MHESLYSIANNRDNFRGQYQYNWKFHVTIARLDVVNLMTVTNNGTKRSQIAHPWRFVLSVFYCLYMYYGNVNTAKKNFNKYMHSSTRKSVKRSMKVQWISRKIQAFKFFLIWKKKLTMTPVSSEICSYNVVLDKSQRALIEWPAMK